MIFHSRIFSPHLHLILKYHLQGFDRDKSLNKHLSGSSSLRQTHLFFSFFRIVKNQITEHLNDLMALSVWSGAHALILTRAFLCLEQTRFSIMHNHVHTHKFTQTHTRISHQVRVQCSDLTSNGPVVWIAISLRKMFTFQLCCML